MGEANVVPLYEDFLGAADQCDSRLFKRDGLHPNRLGQELLGTLIKMKIYSDTTPPQITRNEPDHHQPDDEFKDVKAFNPLVGDSGLALQYGRLNKSYQCHLTGMSGLAPSINDPVAFPPLSDHGPALPSTKCTGYVDALLKPAPARSKVSGPLGPTTSKSAMSTDLSPKKSKILWWYFV